MKECKYNVELALADLNADPNATLIGSRYLGLNSDDSDYDYAIHYDNFTYHLECLFDPELTKDSDNSEYALTLSAGKLYKVIGENNTVVTCLVFKYLHEFSEQISRNRVVKQWLDLLPEEVIYELKFFKNDSPHKPEKYAGSIFFNGVYVFINKEKMNSVQYSRFITNYRKQNVKWDDSLEAYSDINASYMVPIFDLLQTVSPIFTWVEFDNVKVLYVNRHETNLCYGLNAQTFYDIGSKGIKLINNDVFMVSLIAHDEEIFHLICTITTGEIKRLKMENGIPSIKSYDWL